MELTFLTNRQAFRVLEVCVNAACAVKAYSIEECSFMQW